MNHYCVECGFSKLIADAWIHGRRSKRVSTLASRTGNHSVSPPLSYWSRSWKGPWETRHCRASSPHCWWGWSDSSTQRSPYSACWSILYPYSGGGCSVAMVSLRRSNSLWSWLMRKSCTPLGCTCLSYSELHWLPLLAPSSNLMNENFLITITYI